jgi:hypothetical protein
MSTLAGVFPSKVELSDEAPFPASDHWGCSRLLCSIWIEGPDLQHTSKLIDGSRGSTHQKLVSTTPSINRFKMHCSLAWLATVPLLASLSSASLTQADHQQPLFPATNASALATSIQIPETNDSIYGPVPQEEQQFKIKLLDIAPSPFKAYARPHEPLRAIR